MNVINFSGGRTSAYMTKRLIDEGLSDYIVCFQNTGKESVETLDFIHECEVRWNINIAWVEYRKNNGFEVVNYETASRDGRPFNELIEHKKGLVPGIRFRWCTDQLKIQTSKRYLKSLGLKEWTIYNGIRYDEPNRWAKVKNIPSYMDLEMPLVKWKVTKKDVLDYWSKQDFDLKIHDLFGNCDGCFLKGKGKLIEIERQKPGTLDWWAEKETIQTFRPNVRFEQLIKIAKSGSRLFDDDPSFECFCNID